jgi:uncharacterized protein (TIGR03435 family)
MCSRIKTAAVVVLLLLLSVVTASSQNQPLAFEVASVKPAAPSNGSVMVGCYFPRMRFAEIPKGMCIAKNATLRSVIFEAYEINARAFNIGDYIQGGPGWVGSDRFDIQGKAEDVSATTGQLHAMLRSLLVERFKLQAHEVTKDESGYALVVGSNGAKLTPTTGDKPVSVYAVGQPPKEFGGLNAEMAVVAAYLSRRFNRPIVDRTGLTARYDFKVALLTDDATHSLNESDIHAVAKALEELGLHLRPEKLPVVRVMIDHAEKPSEN